MAILIIEDDESDAMLLARALRREGHAPLTPILNRADEAIRYLEGAGKYADRQRFPLPSLIIMDLSLPGMPGLEFLDWLRDKPSLSCIPVIVLSGSPFAGDVKRAYALGAKTFFTKPMDYEELEQLARSIVRYWTASTPPSGEQKWMGSSDSSQQASS